MKAKQSIPIAMATDQNYIAATMVAIHSIAIHSNKDLCYKIYILSDKPLSFLEKKCLSASAGKHSNLIIRFFAVGDRHRAAKLASDGPVKGITKTTFLRFLLPDLLPDIPKILYMDVDTVVLGDLSEVFRHELGDCCVGGVRDMVGWQDKDGRCVELGIPDLDHYINAGVMLLDLGKFRERALSRRLLQEAETKTYPYNDQDIINSICYGSIHLLPFRCNAIVDYMQNPTDISKALEVDYITQTTSPIILHYAGRAKPWYHPEGKLSSHWWDVANAFIFPTRVMFWIYLHRLSTKKWRGHVHRRIQ